MSNVLSPSVYTIEEKVMGTTNERIQASPEPLGPAEGSGPLSAHDSGGARGTEGVGSSGRDESGRLPRVSSQGEDSAPGSVGGVTTDHEPSIGGVAGKALGQWVFKYLEYQLAYHSSSIDWYQVEIEGCQKKIRELEAEIVRYREAIDWHRHYLDAVTIDIQALNAEAAEPEE
ncbi:hypothetical protein [Leptolyngbya sp. KIOST-1]|uniref:hypothetical protein n=1 Tax=Leptolyngbya sp. KIOST-1 TaxID=1229172 RepID=UPI0012E0C055|nr:hypothetical protein [Leptolyngbya sp. KIOST-1]